MNLTNQYISFLDNMTYQKKYREKVLDKQILDTIKRINELLTLNIFLAGLRLMGLAVYANELMKMYNGNRNWRPVTLLCTIYGERDLGSQSTCLLEE